MPILTTVRRFLSHYWVTSNTIRYRIELRSILHCIQSIPHSDLNGTLVDLGAGSGEMSRRLLKHGQWNQLIGIEPDPQNFSLLQKNRLDLPLSKSIQGSLLEIPLPDASVDWVLSTQVLEHIEDDQRAASEIFRILKPGGYAVISVPHPPEIFPNPGHVRPGYTEEQLRELFDPSHFYFLKSSYCYVIETLRRLTAIEEFPFLRFFYFLSQIDREKDLSEEAKKKSQPYVIVVLLKKL